MKKCIAILGAETERAQLLVEKLAARPYRLLLMAQDADSLASLTEKLTEEYPLADIQSMACQIESSWEADIIFIAASADREKEILSSIKDFATQKILISIAGERGESNSLEMLQPMLPYSKVLTLVYGAGSQYMISGSDAQALEEAEDILDGAGFHTLTCLNVH